MKIMLPSIKQKLDTLKEFFIIESWVDKENEMEAGFTQGIIARYMLN